MVTWADPPHPRVLRGRSAPGLLVVVPPPLFDDVSFAGLQHGVELQERLSEAVRVPPLLAPIDPPPRLGPEQSPVGEPEEDREETEDKDGEEELHGTAGGGRQAPITPTSLPRPVTPSTCAADLALAAISRSPEEPTRANTGASWP